MISILIPIFNYDVRPLAHALIKESKDHSIDMELILIDDGSDMTFRAFNKELQTIDHVTYEELNHNVGRARIRNLLASKASYDHLIFLDCDGMPTHSNFIQTYLDHVDQDIVCGGRTYTSELVNENYSFHWTYGRQREVKSAADRSLHPNRSFMTNNFMTKKEVIQKIRFNEDIEGYGHEDTLFGFELSEHHIAIHHIENPMTHIGLDDNSTFLLKSEKAIQNLVRLIQDESISKPFAQENISIYRTYQTLKQWKMTGVFQFIYRMMNHRIQANLKSNRLNLRNFDLFRLNQFIDAMRQASSKSD